MCLLIPLTDELFKLRAQIVFGCEVDDAQAFALEDAKPLFDLIHPRTMHRSEVHHEARMLDESCSDVFPMMGTDIVADEMNRPEVLGNLPV